MEQTSEFTRNAHGRFDPAVTTTFRAFLELIRPPNTVTALADVLAGAAVAGGFAIYFGEAGLSIEPALIWLLLAGVGLYAGGITFNDVFDASLDARERPERAIPSGRVTRRGASLLGGVLLAGGVTAAFGAGFVSGLIALSVAAGTFLYNGIAKHHAVAGPVVMGLCRAGNLLLGMSIALGQLAVWWPLGALPLLYIGAVTAVSRGEVLGGRRVSGVIALGALGAVFGQLIVLGVLSPYFQLWHSFPFLLLLAGLVLPPFVLAATSPTPALTGRAVKAGVLSLVVLNAALAAGFAGWVTGLVVLALLPLSRGLARAFVVT